MVGYVIGRGGEHINNIQSNCGVRLQFQNGTLSHRDIQISVFECGLHHFLQMYLVLIIVLPPYPGLMRAVREPRNGWTTS